MSLTVPEILNDLHFTGVFETHASDDIHVKEAERQINKLIREARIDELATHILKMPVYVIDEHKPIVAIGTKHILNRLSHLKETEVKDE